MTDGDAEPLFVRAGFGGAVARCAALELLGGSTLLGGLAAAVGRSTDLAHPTVVGSGGLLASLFALGDRQFGGRMRV